jgi:hypothetical protein
VILALMGGEDTNAQVVFDGMWEFFNDNRSVVDPRLMDWWVPANEGSDTEGDDSAFDGDCDIAYALLLADAQWGSGDRLDYRALFEDVVSGVLESTIGPQSRLPMLGDWVEPEGETYNQYTTRSSDLMPDHFRAFQRATGNPVWDEVVTAGLDLVNALQSNFGPTTGLLPDFSVPGEAAIFTPQPAPPHFLEGPHDGHYYFNAGRDPWRIGSDALLYGDTHSADQARQLSEWIRTKTVGEPQNIKEGYTLLQAVLFGFGAAVGFALALILFTSLREKIDRANPPKAFRGVAIALLTAGLLSLAFMGFAGLVK